MDVLIKVFKQVSWQVIAKVISIFSTFIILGLITRTYGKEGTGVYTLVLAYLNFFFLACDFGLNSYVISRLENKEEANKLFNARIYWSFVLMVLANVLLLFMPFSTPLFNLCVLIGSVAIVFSGVYNSANLIFQNKLSYERSAIAASISSLVVLPIFFVLVYYGAPISALVSGSTFGWFVTSLLAVFLVKRFYFFKLTFPPLSYIKEVLKKAWPVSLTLVLNVVYFRIDSFILSAHYSFSDVGVYNLAYQVFQALLVIPTFIMNSYYPIMLETLRNSRAVFIRHISVALLGMLGVGVLGMILTWVLSPFVINLLGGNEFSESIGVLRILSLGFPAFFISSVLMWVLVSLKEYKTMLAIYVVGLAVNLILNLLFIPNYSYIAASWVTGISEYLILALQIIILSRQGYLKFRERLF